MENVNIDLGDKSKGIHEKLSVESMDITPEIQEGFNNNFSEIFNNPILD